MSSKNLKLALMKNSMQKGSIEGFSSLENSDCFDIFSNEEEMKIKSLENSDNNWGEYWKESDEQEERDFGYLCNENKIPKKIMKNGYSTDFSYNAKVKNSLDVIGIKELDFYKSPMSTDFKSHVDFNKWLKDFFKFIAHSHVLLQFKDVVSIKEKSDYEQIFANNFKIIAGYNNKQRVDAKISLWTVFLLEANSFLSSPTERGKSVSISFHQFIADEIDNLLNANRDFFFKNSIALLLPNMKEILGVSYNFHKKIKSDLRLNFVKNVCAEMKDNPSLAINLFKRDFKVFLGHYDIVLYKDSFFKMMASINFFEINYSDPCIYSESPFFSLSFVKPGSLDFFIELLLELVKREDLELYKAQDMFEEYVSKKNNILDSWSGMRSGNRANIMRFVKSADVFWNIYFKYIGSFEHKYSAASVTEDLILESFYTCDFIKNKSSNLRIPSQYVVSLNNIKSNIVLGLTYFAKTHKEKTNFCLEPLENLILQNDKVLLRGKFNEFSSIAFAKEHFSEELYNKICATPKFSLFSLFKSKKSEVYQDLGNNKIRFVSVKSSVLIEKEAPVAAVSSITGINPILLSWGLNRSEENKSLMTENVMNELNDFAQKVSNAREFLKNFPSVGEDANFIEERVDHYVKDLFNQYFDSSKKQEAIKKISLVSLSISLEDMFLENLNVLGKQVQFSIDEIVKASNKDTVFDAKTTGVFMEYRFPNAVDLPSDEGISDLVYLPLSDVKKNRGDLSSA